MSKNVEECRGVWLEGGSSDGGGDNGGR